MKMSLRRHISKLVKLRPNSYSALVASICRPGKALDYRALVSAVNRRRGKLICCGSNLRLEFALADIEPV